MSDSLTRVRGVLTPSATTLRRITRAFTLVELLVVMGIIVLLASMILPALKGTLDGVNLTGAAEGVSSQLSLARQTAMSRNLPVEVRIYNHSTTDSNPPYDRVALVIPALASGRPLDEWVNVGTPFNGGVVADTGTSSTGEKFSTVFNTTGNTPPTTLLPNPTAPWMTSERTTGTTAPPTLRGLTYYAFRFQPDGSTDLPALTPDASAALHWCLSLKNGNAKPPANNAAVPAPSYVALVFDPRTGRVLIYKP